VSNSVYKEFSLKEASLQERIEDFWKHAHCESESFHKRIETGEHFLRDKWPVRGPNDMDCHYFFSNLGVKFDSLPDTSLVKITEHYKFTNTINYLKCIFYCSATTINKNIFMSLMFSNIYVNQEFVDSFQKNFDFILKQII
jgi:hypothetical protein